MLNTIKTKIHALSSDRKSVLTLVGGTTIAQALSFLFSPIQTRLFSPEVFGELSVFGSITGIVGIIICLRYELAIVLPKDDDESFALYKLALLFAAIVSGLAGIVFFLWHTQIYTSFNAATLSRYWYYVPVVLFLTGVIQASNYWLTRQRKFKVLSINKVAPVIAINVLSIRFWVCEECRYWRPPCGGACGEFLPKSFFTKAVTQHPLALFGCFSKYEALEIFCQGYSYNENPFFTV